MIDANDGKIDTQRCAKEDFQEAKESMKSHVPINREVNIPVMCFEELGVMAPSINLPSQSSLPSTLPSGSSGWPRSLKMEDSTIPLPRSFCPPG